MISYEFLTTQKIEEAINYLDKFSKVHILAGGTDLLVKVDHILPMFMVAK